MVFVGKEGFGNVEVLFVVDFIPLFIFNGQRFQLLAIEEGDDAEHILVVFIIAHRLAIGFKKRHIFLLRKCFGEFVDVHRFVVLVHILIVERGLGHEVHDMVVGIDAHHGAIHPRFIFSHESQVGEGVIHQLMEHFIVENQVAFYQQCVVGLQRIFGERQ